MHFRSTLFVLAFLASVGTASAQSTATGGISLSVTDGRTSIAPGDSMIYIVTASQNTQATRDVTVTLTLPSGLDLISPDNGGQVIGQTVRWTNATLTQGTNRIFTVQARVINSTPTGTVLTATASIDTTQATDATTVQSGAAATKSYVLTLTDNASTVRAGGTLNYVLTVKNNSSVAQTETVTVQGPTTLSVQSGTPLPTSVGTNTVSWSNVSFNPGEVKTFTFSALVDANARTNTSIETRATAGNATLSDFTAVNNNASSSRSSSSSSSSSRTSSSSSRRAATSSVRSVASSPLFRVEANVSEVAAGGQISYTIFVQNVLLQNVRDGLVTLRFDPATAEVANAGSGTASPNEVRWQLPTLGAGQTWQTAVALRAKTNLSAGSLVTVTSRLTGNDVSGTVLTERVSTITTSVVSALPDTGAAFDMLFLALTGLVALLFGITQKQVKRS